MTGQRNEHGRPDGVHESLCRDIVALRTRLEALERGVAEPCADHDIGAETVRNLSSTFALSSFETQLLLLCAAFELDSGVAAACGRLQPDERQGRVTFALASRVLADPHWSALLPTAALRYWRLLEMEPSWDVPVTHARLRIAERVLHHVTGLVSLDEPLHGYVSTCSPSGDLWSPHSGIATRLTEFLATDADRAVMLTGADPHARRRVAAHACAVSGLRLYATRTEDLPTESVERDRFARLWMREALLAPTVLLVEGAVSAHVTALCERVRTSVVVSADEASPLGVRPTLRLHLPTPGGPERREWWRKALRKRAGPLSASLDTLAMHFCLSQEEIVAAVDACPEATPEMIWNAARVQARPALGNLAQRIDPAVEWGDLVLPPAQLAVLRQMAAQVRHQLRVYEDWGFGMAGRGLGVSALFAGASGTGKTMASEVLARELGLDLYRIDLSQVVSKYIGETEKNLRRVFDAAEGGGVILLFDEADALFGKRSDVKDSHDRYANIEVSYLLQRMEAYRGLAILTTNMRGSLDPAFLRRLRFVVEFPFPDTAGRAEIWRRVFPAQTPTEGLDPERLAQLTVAGGNIRNIALNAAFIAADAERSVRMTDLLQAARTECAKVNKPLSDAEIRHWV